MYPPRCTFLEAQLEELQTYQHIDNIWGINIIKKVYFKQFYLWLDYIFETRAEMAVKEGIHWNNTKYKYQQDCRC